MADQQPSVEPVEPVGASSLARNGRRARWLHMLVYLSTVFLAYSGIAVLLEAHPGLSRPLGGHVPTATSHRLVGYGLLIAAVLVLVVWRRAAGRFLADSVSFSRLDLSWLAGYPRLALIPGRSDPTPHRGHFDPGQRIFNLLLILALVVLGATGIVMGMPERFLPSVFGWCLRVHKLATWVLIGLVAGHLLLASGLLPGYRGVWRAMHLSGRVPTATARRLWPLWSAARQRRSEAQDAGGACQPSTDQLEERGARRQPHHDPQGRAAPRN